jgi:subtilisin family serine protease
MAALPGSITIGAIDRWRQRALFSGQGPAVFEGQKILKPDFCAPGSAVMGPTDDHDYKLGSGTLQAAAHFAGLYLLLRQARPDTDPEYLIAAMKITCADLAETGPDYQTGYGLPVPAAVLSYIDNPPSQNR